MKNRIIAKKVWDLKSLGIESGKVYNIVGRLHEKTKSIGFFEDKKVYF